MRHPLPGRDWIVFAGRWHFGLISIDCRRMSVSDRQSIRRCDRCFADRPARPSGISAGDDRAWQRRHQKHAEDRPFDFDQDGPPLRAVAFTCFTDFARGCAIVDSSIVGLDGTSETPSVGTAPVILALFCQAGRCTTAVEMRVIARPGPIRAPMRDSYSGYDRTGLGKWRTRGSN